MMTLVGNYRSVFHKKIKKFYLENGIIIEYMYDMGNLIDYWIEGEPQNINEFFEYLNLLEKEYIECKNHMFIDIVKRRN